MNLPTDFRGGKIFATACCAAVVFVIAIAMVMLRAPASSPKTAEPAAQPLAPNTFKPTPAQWDNLTRATVNAKPFRSEVVTDGNIATNDNATVSIFSPYSGRVAKLNARLGDVIHKGDALMEVDASEFVQGQNDLVTALSALNTALTQQHLAEKTENRQHELFLAKAGAQKDWLQSQSDLTAAQNTVRAAEISLTAVRNRLRILGKSDTEIAAIEHPAGARHLGTAAVVKAPISGTVVQRQVGIGQYIQSAAGGAATPLFTIADLSSLWLIANLREADVGAVKVGQTVEVRVPAFPERVFKARLTWVSPLVDPTTHRVPVRAEIDNRDQALKPQMLANFTIVTGTATRAVAVPQSAVIYEGSNARVFVANSDHTIASRSIEVGAQNGDMTEVISGISAGESIITGGALFIDRAIKGDGA